MANTNYMSDDARERFEELKGREASGELDDAGRQELSQLKDDLGIMDE